MPVILSRDEYAAWLDRQVTNPARLVHLFQPYPADLMEMWKVLPLVNNIRNDSADLILPVGDDTISG
jgi:putative SOS response-associated peptidase YedK